jgi:hypothetical protein
MRFAYIALDRLVIKDNIRSDPDEHLGELMDSMERLDVFSAILVEPDGKNFAIIFGHRRVEATRMRGESHAPCLIVENVSARDRVFIQIAENAVRKNLSPEEWVALFDKMHAADPTMTDAKIEVSVGKRPGWCASKRMVVSARETLVETGTVKERDLKGMTASEVMDGARALRPRKQGSGRAPHEVEEGRPSIVSFRKGLRAVTFVCRYGFIRERIEKAVEAVKKQVDAEDVRASKGKTA